jgi:hypothetical protein
MEVLVTYAQRIEALEKRLDLLLAALRVELSGMGRQFGGPALEERWNAADPVVAGLERRKAAARDVLSKLSPEETAVEMESIVKGLLAAADEEEAAGKRAFARSLRKMANEVEP